MYIVHKVKIGVITGNNGNETENKGKIVDKRSKICNKMGEKYGAECVLGTETRGKKEGKLKHFNNFGSTRKKEGLRGLHLDKF